MSVLVSGVEQIDSVIHIHLSILLSDSVPCIGHYRLLSRVPCAKQEVLVHCHYLFYI